jgi:sulfur carrier protein ThiS
MPVTVQATGTLRQRIPPGTAVDAATVGDALAQLDLPESEEVLILVNNRIARWDTALADGDVLQLVLGISGGDD